MRRLAVFVTPHGFGHAARISAVLAALAEREPALEVLLFTTVPGYFFEQALPLRFELVEAPVDVGVVQRTPVEEDPAATLAALERWEGLVERASAGWLERMLRFGAEAVLSDIAPLGIELAARAGLPAILVESFTWQWIYERERQKVTGLGRFAERFARADALATLRIRTEPFCEGEVVYPREHRVRPVAHPTIAGPEAVRRRLGVGSDERLVVVSLGGVPWSPGGGETWSLGEAGVVAVVGGEEPPRRAGSVWWLPHRLPWPHRDLVAAADLVVGKLGYSTLVEAWAAGSRFLHVPRPGFRESAVLAEWAAARLPTAPTTLAALESGAWREAAARLLDLPRPAPGVASGAAEAAATIAGAFWR